MKLAAIPKQFLLALSQYSHRAHAACIVAGSQDLFVLCRCREPAQLLLLGGVVVRAVVRTVLHSAVVHRGGARGRVLSTPPLLALVQLPKGIPELLRHEVVDDGVDGAVQVDAEAAEEEEPGVQVGRVHEGVHHHQRAVRQPQHGEESHHHSQHLGHLDRGDMQKEKQPDGAQSPAELSHLELWCRQLFSLSKHLKETPKPISCWNHFNQEIILRK